MPAVSKAQQKFMGMVHALQKGELSPDEVSADVRQAAATMKKKDAKDFASTKHKGLPAHKTEESIIPETKDSVIDNLVSVVKNHKEGISTDELQKIVNTPIWKRIAGSAGNLKDAVKDFINPKRGYVEKKGNMLYSLAFESVEEGFMGSGSVANDARSLSSGTMSDLTGLKNSKEIEKIQNNFVQFAMKNKSKYRTWHDAWKVFWKDRKNENIKEAWVSGGDKKYDRNNIPTGSTVKVDYGTYKGKIGKVIDDAAADGFSIVKVAGKVVTYHNSDLLVKENLNEKFPADWQLDPRKLDTQKVQVWSKSGTMLTAQMPKKEAQQLVKNRKAFVVTGQAIGLFEGLLENTDEKLAKQGIVYAKKKYKYDPKETKDLAKDLLMYMKSGDVSGQADVEAYIDFRHDEMMKEVVKHIRSMIREIITEENAIMKAKNIIQNIFKRNDNKIGDKEYKDLFSKGSLKTHGSMAVNFAWNDLQKNNKIKKQGKEWVWVGA